MQSSQERRREEIAGRWHVDPTRWRWPFPPAHVRVLLYAEGGIQFAGGSFLGMQHLLTTLRLDPYSWVKFDVTTANRGPDPSADHQGVTLDALNLAASYDEVWLFGFSGGDLLGPAEKAALADFMDAHRGGLLVTGDHAALGQGIAGAIPRAGKMRLYPAPPNFPPTWNTTVEEGSDPDLTFDFEDQSDDVPQTIRWRKYPLWSLFSTPLRRRVRPHPLLCGPEGPIDVLPDHEHEGEAVVPASFPAAEWPSGPAGQPRPEVIAWGRIKDPAATRTGQEIGVISAYDGHEASVGRIAADSTWHHFFDINLTGLPGDPVYRGFPATPAGQAALKKIEAYYLNLAIWLAPPGKQADMRWAASWRVLWSDRWMQLASNPALLEDPRHHLFVGEQAIDALGRIAPRCTGHQWLFVDLLRELDPALLARVRERLEREQVVPDLLGHFMAGGAFAELTRAFGPAGRSLPPREMPEAKAFQAALRHGAARGLGAGVAHFRELAGAAAELVGPVAGAGEGR